MRSRSILHENFKRYSFLPLRTETGSWFPNNWCQSHLISVTNNQVLESWWTRALGCSVLFEKVFFMEKRHSWSRINYFYKSDSFYDKLGLLDNFWCVKTIESMQDYILFRMNRFSVESIRHWIDLVMNRFTNKSIQGHAV